GTCGRKTSVSNETIPRGRIIGGNQVAPGEWPWVVSIRLNGELMCGGVLVGRKWVITAAHCFTGNGNELYWSVAVGEYNLSKKDETEEIMQVNRIIAHPKFNQKTFNNDIALVELTLPAPVSDQINFVCLPGSWADPKIGTSCYITGWGSLYEDGPSAEALMEAKVPVLSQSSCKTALGKGLVTSTMFCAGYLSGGVDSCQGDSGGPLTCQDPTSKQHYLYGITSWGDGCGERGKPGIYTRVTAFTDWITQEIRKPSGSREPTCFELMRLSELPEEERWSEFSHLCSFYSHSCQSSQGPSACSRTSEEKCRNRIKKCELRSFVQNLLDFLRRVEDFIWSKVDFSFFTQTIPKFLEGVRDVVLQPTRQLLKHSFPKNHPQGKAKLCPGCQGLNETTLRMQSLREALKWILEVPEQDLSMKFQEVLVDVASKNEKGLYKARVRATIGGKPVTFYSMVGLERESLYRSIPGILALALDALK
uniref:Serine protease 56 n=1 Tax=Latimeria chalumnae TaxID=7897 RepID=H3B747_LATCH